MPSNKVFNLYSVDEIQETSEYFFTAQILLFECELFECEFN